MALPRLDPAAEARAAAQILRGGGAVGGGGALAELQYTVIYGASVVGDAVREG